MNTVILLAAGKSLRAGQSKLWAKVFGQPLWTFAYRTFLEHPLIGHIILVVPKGDEFRFLPFVDSEKTTVIAGGETRMGSFKSGLATVDFADDDVIMDHNAANPKVTAREISEVLESAKKFGAASVSLPAVDAVHTTDGENYGQTLDREKLRLMQTPQAVRGDILRGIELAETSDLTSALLQKTTVKIIEANPANRKITYAEDLESLSAQTFVGEDSHRFSNEGQLILGGLSIPELPALDANSDGDVILHAIGRALAEACGQNFSELADPLSLSGVQDSRDYLLPFLEKVPLRHVSISLECTRPKIDPIVLALKASLGRILNLKTEQIHISAHSGEDLTAFGRGEGIRCLALIQISPR